MGSEFGRRAAGIGSNVQKISQNVSSMQRLLQSSNADDPALMTQINSIIHYTGQLAKDTKEDLKGLSCSTEKEEKMLKEKLTSDFTAVLNLFQAAQRTAAAREKAKVQSLTKPPDYYAGQVVLHSSSAAPLVQTQQARTDLVDLEELRERENSIRQLESDILDVNQIFKELATMVHEQGETIDSIEANIESSSFSVHQGTQEIGAAAKYQTSARRKKLCLLGGLVILLLVIVLLIKYT